MPSRRLGMSLGVDMAPPKTCTLNCVYCECGPTTCHTMERKSYIPAGDIINELDRFLAPASQSDIDVITFGGSGEPTLHTDLDIIVGHLKACHPRYKTALLTNATLLHMDEVRRAVMPVDYVLPSLDAASQPVFEKINAPVAGLRCSMVVDGLKAFAREYTGALWVEVFIVPGINDTEQELAAIREILVEVNPARVQLNTLDRPGTCGWVRPASPGRLSKIAGLFLPLPVEIVTRQFHFPQTAPDKPGNIERIFATLKRRPLTIEDLAVALKKNINETQMLVKGLMFKKMLVAEKAGDRTFYRPA